MTPLAIVSARLTAAISRLIERNTVIGEFNGMCH